MKYQIVIESTKSQNKERKESYDNLQSAQKKIDKSYKNKDAEIIPIPENITIGYKIYVQNEIYGTIVDEDDHFYYVNRFHRDQNDKALFLKSEFENKFINGIFEGRE